MFWAGDYTLLMSSKNTLSWKESLFTFTFIILHKWTELLKDWTELSMARQIAWSTLQDFTTPCETKVCLQRLILTTWKLILPLITVLLRSVLSTNLILLVLYTANYIYKAPHPRSLSPLSTQSVTVIVLYFVRTETERQKRGINVGLRRRPRLNSPRSKVNVSFLYDKAS